jgi:hypothetical protein
MQNRRLFKASITSLLSLRLGKLASAPSRWLREQASEPSHTLRRGSGRGSCLAPGARHTFTSLQTERRPGSSHCQTPEGTQRAAHKPERTTPTVFLTGPFAPHCHPEQSDCHPEQSDCHPEQSEGSRSNPERPPLALSPPIVILNKVKDLLPIPNALHWPFHPPIVILNKVKDLLPIPNALHWPFSRAFAHSWKNCTCMVFRHRGGKSYSRCRFIVHIADLSALILIHEFPECTI